jgi:hypothetical protein
LPLPSKKMAEGRSRRERKPSLGAKEAADDREYESLVARGQAPPDPPKSRRGRKSKAQLAAEALEAEEAAATAMDAAAPPPPPPFFAGGGGGGSGGLPQQHALPLVHAPLSPSSAWQHTLATMRPHHRALLDARAAAAHGGGAFASLDPEEQRALLAAVAPPPPPHLYPPPGAVPLAPPVLPPGGEGAAPPGAPPFLGAAVAGAGGKLGGPTFGGSGSGGAALELPLVRPPSVALALPLVQAPPPAATPKPPPHPRAPKPQQPLSWPERGPDGLGPALPHPRLDFLSALPHDAKAAQLLHPASLPPPCSSSSSGSGSGLLSLPNDLLVSIFDLAFDASPDPEEWRYESHAVMEVAGLVLSCSSLRRLLGPRLRFATAAAAATNAASSPGGSNGGANSQPSPRATDAPPSQSPIPLDTWRRVRHRQRAKICASHARAEYSLTDGWLAPLPHVRWVNPRDKNFAAMKMYRRDHVAVAARLRWDGVPEGGSGRRRATVEGWAVAAASGAAALRERVAVEVARGAAARQAAVGAAGGGAGGGRGGAAASGMGGAGGAGLPSASAAAAATGQKRRAVAAAAAAAAVEDGGDGAVGAAGRAAGEADAAPTKRSRVPRESKKKKVEAAAAAGGGGGGGAAAAAPHFLPPAPATTMGGGIGVGSPTGALHPGVSVLQHVFACHHGIPPLTSTPPRPPLPPPPPPALPPQPLPSLTQAAATAHGPEAAARLQELAAVLDANSFGTPEQRAQILGAVAVGGAAGAVDPILAALREFVLGGVGGGSAEEAFAQFQSDASSAAQRRQAQLQGG